MYKRQPIKSGSVRFSLVSGNQTVDGCVLQIGNGGQGSTPKILGVHEIVHKPHDFSANGFLTACLVGVDIQDVYKRQLVSVKPCTPTVSASPSPPAATPLPPRTLSLRLPPTGLSWLTPRRLLWRRSSPTAKEVHHVLCF